MFRRPSAVAAALLVASAVSTPLVAAGPAHADSGDRWVQGHVVNPAGQPLTNRTAEAGWCETKAHHKGCTRIRYAERSGIADYNTDQNGSFILSWPVWKHPAKPGHWVVTIDRDPSTIVRISKPRAGHGVHLKPIVEKLRTGTPLPTGWTGPTLSGTVTGIDGAPIPNTQVWITNGTVGLSPSTDGGGNYEVAVPAGTTGLTMEVQAVGYLWYHDVPVTGSFTGAAAVHQDVVMSAMGRLKAHLVIPKSWRTWRTRVHLHNTSQPSIGVTYRALGPGKVNLNVDPGTYVLTMTARPKAHSKTLRTATRTVTVTSGHIVDLGHVDLHKS